MENRIFNYIITNYKNSLYLFPHSVHINMYTYLRLYRYLVTLKSIYIKNTYKQCISKYCKKKIHKLNIITMVVSSDKLSNLTEVEVYFI